MSSRHSLQGTGDTILSLVVDKQAARPVHAAIKLEMEGCTRALSGAGRNLFVCSASLKEESGGLSDVCRQAAGSMQHSLQTAQSGPAALPPRGCP